MERHLKKTRRASEKNHIKDLKKRTSEDDEHFKETGVNYLYHAAGYSGGMTPLLDREGKPVVSPIVNK